MERGGGRGLAHAEILEAGAMTVAPNGRPRRHVYVCAAGTMNVRNHLAVRDILRRRDDLRDEYAGRRQILSLNDPSR
ncbi:GrpB family protein [Nocardioides sp. NPDC127514]|uniref:GrpB family protein n=1 Tax=Nocardioides sp. NPDC127514 TaxID=3154243 RepID=UPI0033249CEC